MTPGVERRQFQRHAVSCPVRAALRLGPNQCVPVNLVAHLRSISRGGAGLVLPPWAAAHVFRGQHIDLCLDHPALVARPIHCEVVWAKRDAVGLRFLGRERAPDAAALYRRAVGRSGWYDPSKREEFVLALARMRKSPIPGRDGWIDRRA